MVCVSRKRKGEMPDFPVVGGMLFDYGGTLVAGESPGEVLNRGLEGLGISTTHDQCNRMEELVRAYWEDHYSAARRGSRWSTEIEVDCNRAALEAMRITDEPGILSLRLSEARQGYAGLTLYDDVKETLEKLKSRGLMLAVVSQTLHTSEGLKERLEHFGIGSYFDEVVTSESAGYDKPDPRLFEYAADALGIKAEGLCHVGDVYELDVLGARKAKMFPVLIDRRGTHLHEDVLTVPTLSLLPGYVEYSLRSR